MDDAEWNAFFLANLPSFIAKSYWQILQAYSSQERVTHIVHTYTYLLRALTIYLVSQYLIPDAKRVTNAALNEFLLKEFPEPQPPDKWQELLFTVLNAYEGKRQLFFIPELYDWYWETSTRRHQPRPEVEHTLRRLTRVAVLILGEEVGELPQSEDDWTTLEQELLHLLNTLLRNLSFLSYYQLIRILAVDKEAYQFESHRGLTITPDQEPLPPMKLRLGYFYLRKDPHEFLRLHPLLVLWDKEAHGEAGATDTGIYDALVYDESLRYLLAPSGRKMVIPGDEQSVKEFLLLVIDTVEQMKRQRQEAERLTWWELRKLCQNITRLRMTTVRHKFRQELYLPRHKTQQAFERFLQSEKRCMVLIGKSGVGKTSFLLALADTLSQDRSDLCVLMYDGANISVQPSITHFISQDFADRFRLSGRQIEDVWREINQVDGISERTVLLIVDALNEHPQANEALRQVNALVQRPWPWLKIVLSSRPETWRTIKRGINLAEGLYYQADESKGEATWEPTSLAEQLEPFSRDELSLAYARYQEEFALQTPFEALSPPIRELLRDPLTLWLVASTHRGQVIPASLKTTGLVEQYVDELVRSSRLEPEDLDFLETQLVPLMVGEGHYTNEITTADLTTRGERLQLKITSEELLSSGRRMNQSFQNLVDAEILVRRQERRGRQIAFKYERFYEFFIGERIFVLSKTHTDRLAFFAELIGQTSRIPFLWGAVRDALLQEAVISPETIIQLCFTDQQRVKEMLVDALIRFGLDHPEQVSQRLQPLLPPEPKATAIHRIRGLFGKTDVNLGVRSRNAGKIAVEVASRLKLPHLLQSAALQADPTIRTTAVRYSYLLWQYDHEVGFEILEQVAETATTGLIPNLSAFESMLGLSAVICFGSYQDEVVLRRLQSIWQKIIAQLLRLQESSSRLGGVIRAFLREYLFSLVVRIAFGLLNESSDTHNISYQGLKAFFQLGRAEKALYRNLVRYIDVAGTYSKGQMDGDYLKAIKINDILMVNVVNMGLIAHTCTAPLSMLPLLKKLLDEARHDVAAYPALSEIANIADNVLDHGPLIEEVYEFFNDAVEACHTYHTQYPQAIKNRRTAEVPATEFLGPHLLFQYRKLGTAKTTLLERQVQAARARNDIRFFDLLLTLELPVVSMQRREPQAALQALELFFHTDEPQIARLIQTFLARLRLYFPDEVDDFLEDQQASDEFRLQVQTNAPDEKVGALIGQRSWYFLRDVVIPNSPALRRHLIQVFDKAADCRNLQDWLNYFIREIVNLLYGSEVLRQAR